MGSNLGGRKIAVIAVIARHRRDRKTMDLTTDNADDTENSNQHSAVSNQPGKNKKPKPGTSALSVSSVVWFSDRGDHAR
jgi:hypothetical protein